MSMQNLAHVCSHLQNTSRARLGKTSVKLTKLHLAVALALQKQGLISTVEVGGTKAPEPRKDTILPKNGDILRYNQYRRLVANLRRAPGEVRRLEPWAWMESTYKQPIGWLPPRIEASPIASTASPPDPNEPDVESTREESPPAQNSTASTTPPEGANASTAEPSPWPEPALDPDTVLSEAEYSLRPWILHYSPHPHRPRQIKEFLANPALIQKYDSVSLLSYEAWQASSNALAHGLQTSSAPLLADEPWRCYPDPHAYFNRPGLRSAPDPWELVPHNPAARRLWLGLKYWRNEPVISKCNVVSTGSRRIAMKQDQIARLARGGIAQSTKGVMVRGLRRVGECMFFRTDLGILEARECVARRRGGLALCRVA